MKERLTRLLPCCIAAGVILALCFIRATGFLEPIELLTFDLRAKLAQRFSFPIATNLACVEVDGDSLNTLSKPELGGQKFPFPRKVYGRVISELKAQGAKVVGIDLFFLDLEPDYVENRVENMSSDEYFARELARAGNVVLATTPAHVSDTDIKLELVPDLFRTNALALGHDGILGRGSVHGVFRKATAYVDDKAFGERLWHLGIVMAAKALGLDLDHAVIRPGSIILTNKTGLKRLIPIDSAKRFYIDWSIKRPEDRPDDPVLRGVFAEYYIGSLLREGGRPVESSLDGRLVLIGFAASGQSASDWGMTPVSDKTPLYLSHLAVVNSLLTNRFIYRTGWMAECVLIVCLAVAAAFSGWRLSPLWGLGAMAALCLVYCSVACWLYVARRYWLPVGVPLGGAFVMTYICLLSWRIVVESTERRRFHMAFGRVVSPSIFNLLVQQPLSSFRGARRNVTVCFADVRGFTRFMEDQHRRVLARLRESNLSGPAAESLLDLEARQTLETVNLYLTLMADIIKVHGGTLDKYIGDCVMAFWGAPVAREDHALACVKAAIAIHRAVHSLNEQRQAENQQRQQDNIARQAGGRAILELLPVLHVGSAMNSGCVTVGFMGSESNISNYTVFGREVNIASRLEKYVGPDRVVLTASTFEEVRKHAPELADTFIRLEPIRLEGVPAPVQIYEVPWTLEAPARSHSDLKEETRA